MSVYACLCVCRGLVFQSAVIVSRETVSSLRPTPPPPPLPLPSPSYLKTYSTGACVKESSNLPYSVHLDAPSSPTGYDLLYSRSTKLLDSEVMDVLDGESVEEKDVPLLSGLADFVNGMMSL